MDSRGKLLKLIVNQDDIFLHRLDLLIIDLESVEIDDDDMATQGIFYHLLAARAIYKEYYTMEDEDEVGGDK